MHHEDASIMYQPALIAKYRNPLYQTNTFIIKLIHFYIHTHTHIYNVSVCVCVYIDITKQVVLK